MSRKIIPFSPDRFSGRSPLRDEESSGQPQGDGTTDGVRRQAPYHPAVAMSDATPDNPYEALMRSRPFEEPDESAAELVELWDALRDAISLALDERQQFVVEGLFYERLSLRELADRMSLSKTHIARIRDESLTILRHWLVIHRGDVPRHQEDGA